LLVDEAEKEYSPSTLLVATTPLTLLISTPGATLNILELIILARVLVAPLIIVLKKLPVEVASEVLIMLVEVDTPFTLEVIVFNDENNELEFMILVLEVDPPILDVMVLIREDRVFGTFKLVTFKVLILAVLALM
jgi:hypothetical protein